MCGGLPLLTGQGESTFLWVSSQLLCLKTKFLLANRH